MTAIGQHRCARQRILLSVVVMTGEYQAGTARWANMRRWLVVLALVLTMTLTKQAHAGLFCDEGDAEIREIEAFARNKRRKFSHEYVWLCASMGAPPYAARIEKACTTIIERDGTAASEPCVDLAALAGLSKLGAIDLFEIVAARTEDPLDYPGGQFWPRLSFLRTMKDPRAAPLVVEQWRATEPRANARKKRSGAMQNWSSWRQLAAATIGAVGTTEHAAFLAEQAKGTKDRYVKKACLDAVKAIDARTRAASPAVPPAAQP